MTDHDRTSLASSAQERLEAADAAVAEHRRLQDRLAQAQSSLVAAQEAAAEAEARVAAETADVRALESYSPSRVWASLRGERDAELQREEAERQQAEYFAAVARAEVERVRDEVETLDTSLRRLGDVESTRESALAAKEALVRADEGAAGVVLARISERAGRLRATSNALDEADAAAAEAESELSGALDRLDKADTWALVAPHSGGRALTDIAKHRRMDEAAEHLRRCRGPLRRLTNTLPTTPPPQPFDPLLDTIWADLASRTRLREAFAGTEAAHGQVLDVRRELAERRAELRDELSGLARQREELLA